MSIPVNEHGQPDLQALVARHGGYHKIEAWAEYDRAIAEWQERRRDRSAAPSSDRADPERLCICGLPGVYWRPRQGGGRTKWRCEQHRDQWPDYAEDFPLREVAR